MKFVNTLITLTRATFCTVIFVGVIGAQVPANPKNPDPELVGQLSNQLNVTPTQATSGAGAIFGLVKSHLSAGDFSKVAAAVPGMDGFLKAAPTGGGGSSAGSGLPGLPGGAAGGLASLAGSFQSLGLSPSMVGKFAPIIENTTSGLKAGQGSHHCSQVP